MFLPSFSNFDMYSISDCSCLWDSVSVLSFSVCFCTMKVSKASLCLALAVGSWLLPYANAIEVFAACSKELSSSKSAPAQSSGFVFSSFDRACRLFFVLAVCFGC